MAVGGSAGYPGPMAPIVVGIAGGTASGKTTAARALAEFLGDDCLLVTHDRYYHPLPDALRHDPQAHNFDHPDAIDTARLVADLGELRAGRPARLPRYDFATHARAAEWDPAHPRPVVLVEGILVLADAHLRPLLDHKVFVHTPDDVRLIRRIRRDLTERGRDLHEVLDRYERTVRPMHEAFVAPSAAHADLVLDGTNDVQRLVDSVLDRLGRARRATPPAG